MEPVNQTTRNTSQISKMSSLSSTSSGTGEYDQYMKQYYIKKGDPSSAGLSFTHTRIPSPEHGVTGGTFCILPEKLQEFWAKYSKHVRSTHLHRNHQHHEYRLHADVRYCRRNSVHRGHPDVAASAPGTT